MADEFRSADRSTWSISTTAGLLLALVGPFLTYLLIQALYGPVQSPTRILVATALHWVNFAAVLFIVVAAERRPLASIGVRPYRWWILPLGVVAGAFIAVSSSFLAEFFGLTADKLYATYLQSLSLAMRVLLVITAGVFEETLYRGYALERISILVGSRWLAGAITLLLFTVMHAPAVGWEHLLPVALVGCLVTLLYLWRGDLVLNIVAHTTVDGVGLLL